MIDTIDGCILDELQRDCSRSLDELAADVGLSRNACWRRIRRMEDAGLIKGRVALLDAKQLNVGLTVFIALKTVEHSPTWLAKFSRAVGDIPEIVGVYRMTGEVDYLLQAVVPDVEAYDDLYKRLINRITLADISSSFVMEQIKDTTALPLAYASRGNNRARV